MKAFSSAELLIEHFHSNSLQRCCRYLRSFVVSLTPMTGRLRLQFLHFDVPISVEYTTFRLGKNMSDVCTETELVQARISSESDVHTKTNYRNLTKKTPSSGTSPPFAPLIAAGRDREWHRRNAAGRSIWHQAPGHGSAAGQSWCASQ